MYTMLTLQNAKIRKKKNVNNDNKQTRDLPNVISSDTPRFI